MSPFDLPPSTPAVSFDPPSQKTPGRRSTGRTVTVVATCVALIAAGVLAIALFSSDSHHDVANAAQESGTTPPTPPTAPAPATAAVPAAPPSSVPADTQPPLVTTDPNGKIVIQIGDGPPIVIDLGALGALGNLGAPGSAGDLGKIEQCVGKLPFDLHIDGVPGLNVDANDMTITGPNGISVLHFGDGDGSVTITKKNGNITISSAGDVEVNDLSAPDTSIPSASVPSASLPSLPDFGQIYKCLEGAAG
jgi:hypothetical protein